MHTNVEILLNNLFNISELTILAVLISMGALGAIIRIGLGNGRPKDAVSILGYVALGSVTAVLVADLLALFNPYNIIGFVNDNSAGLYLIPILSGLFSYDIFQGLKRLGKKIADLIEGLANRLT